MTKEFFKQVPLSPSPSRYGREDGMLFLGSCFAASLEQHLGEALFRVYPSPYGVMYNPLSIARGLELLLAPMGEEPFPLISSHGMWHSSMHDSSFSSVDPLVAQRKVREAFQRTREALEEIRLLVVTFGTSYVYRDLERGGEVVSNCHKRPSNAFSRTRLTTEEIVHVWAPLLERLHHRYPSMRLLFTVSPIPHYRDGAHENRLSKATLLLAQDRLIHACQEASEEWISYFPSYEIMQDELRDYRFYASDLAHPTPLAVEYIMGRFAENFLDGSQEDALARRFRSILLRLAHRPLGDDPLALARQKEETLEMLHSLASEIQHPRLTALIEQLSAHT